MTNLILKVDHEIGVKEFAYCTPMKFRRMNNFRNIRESL